MKERHADQGHRKFWSLMKEMTWKERFTHIWYYYARYILLAICILYIAGDVLYQSFKEKPAEILSGTLINVTISTDLEKKLMKMHSLLVKNQAHLHLDQIELFMNLMVDLIVIRI